MKQLFLFLLILTAGCYERAEEKKIIRADTSEEFKKGEYFLKEKKDSAFFYFNKVVENSNDSLQIAMAYNYLATMQMEAGDYFGSQDYLLQSIKHLDQKKPLDRYTLASDYTVLGNNFLSLKSYDIAIGYFDEALKLETDENFRLYPLNSKAVAYQKIGNYDEAIKIYTSIIQKSENNKNEYARILSNLARVKWLRDPSYDALPEFFTALKIRLDKKDDWGLNASYSHLSDYYTNSHPDSALIYASKMYQIAQDNNSPYDQLEALQKLIRLGPLKAIRQYAIRYQRLNDSMQEVRDTANNQLAFVRYESEKNKAENLILQKDNDAKKFQIVLQWTILIGTVIMFLIGAIMAVYWYRKRKQRMELQTQNTIRENQLKTSQHVHDVVANGLYVIMTRLQHQPKIDKEALLDKIEVMYEKSRNISYEIPGRTAQGFQEKIGELLMSFASAQTKVLVVGNNNQLWDYLKAPIKDELQQVLQELMINMKKHSHAKNVVVKFERQDKEIIIQYRDDGIGISSPIQYGNGLTSTENRIKSIGGQVTFTTAKKHGLEIMVTIPYANNDNGK